MLDRAEGLMDIARRSHTIDAYCRLSIDDNNPVYTLADCFIKDGSVTFGALGELPNRTCDITVLTTSKQGYPIMNFLNNRGAWADVGHYVGRDATYMSLGRFRVDSLDVNDLQGTVRFTGSDAGVLVAGYELPTLVAGRVKRNTKLVDAAKKMLEDALYGPYGTGGNNVVVPASTKTSPKDIQYEGSRVDAVLDLCGRLGLLPKVSVELAGNNGVIALVTPKTINDDTPEWKITVGSTGNLEQVLSTLDNTGIFNIALVDYQSDVQIVGARLQHQDRRLIASVTDLNNSFNIYGDYGPVTRSVSVNIDANTPVSEADAIARKAAMDALREGIQQTRSFAIETAPLYGIEAGDLIKVSVDSDDNILVRGVVTGGTIPLLAGPWNINVRGFVSEWTWRPPQIRIENRGGDIVDQHEWVTMVSTPPGVVDMAMNTLKGWHAENGSMWDRGTQIGFYATAAYNGPAVHLYSDFAFKVPAEQRVKVSFKMTSDQVDMDCRAWTEVQGGVRTYGPWVSVPHHHERTVTADLMLTGTTFRIGVQMANHGHTSNVAQYRKFWINSVTVDYARRKKK